MSEIITLAEAKEQLRIDGDADDAWLEMAIPTVENSIQLWLGSETLMYDENDELIPAVKMAALVELARQYLDREGPQTRQMIDWMQYGYTLGPGSTALLQPLRAPRIA